MREKLKAIVDAFPNNEVFIFGETVRDMIVGKNIDKLNVFVKCDKKEKTNIYTKALDYFSENKIDFSHYLIMLDSKLDLSQKLFSIDTIYCNVNDLLKGEFEFESKHKGVEDIHKKVIRINKKHIDRIDNKPDIIFGAIKLATQINFNIEVSTMSLLFSKRHLLTNLPKGRVFSSIKEIFKSCLKPRKLVAFLNTLGISKELFGRNLYESASLNHLNKNDIYEFISLSFSTINDNDLKDTLENKLGLSKSETKTVCNIFDSVANAEDEDELSARKIINNCGKDRIQNISRLLKAIGMKDLAKKMKDQKNSVATFSDLAITAEDIKASFNSDDEETENMLEIAMNKVIEDPNINERSTLLIMLNKIRTST